jgi:hypothetical protein
VPAQNNTAPQQGFPPSTTHQTNTSFQAKTEDGLKKRLIWAMNV